MASACYIVENTVIFASPVRGLSAVPRSRSTRKPVLHGPRRELGTRGEVELRQRARDVALDGALADPELTSDHSVGVALSHELGDVALTTRQSA